MGNILPTLSSSGWIEEIPEKADRLLSYFFVSEHSQSAIFKGSITSLPHLIQAYGNDPSTLKSEVTRKLQNFLERYFDEAAIETEISNAEQPHSRMDLEISVRLRDGGEGYSLARIVKTLNGKVEEFIRVNNEG